MTLLRLKKAILSVLGRSYANGRLAFALSYLNNRHRLPNFRNPTDLSEIWIKRVLDGKIDDIYWLADKYAVRNYVKQRGLEYILTPLLGIYKSPNEIDFNNLPKKFALKANYGAGHNIICIDKAKLDVRKCVEEMQKWMTPQIYSYTERHYNLIDKKIVCEAFIDDGTEGFPIDYKFMCIHGKVVCILGVSGRESGHGSYLPYTIDWKPIHDYFRGKAKATVPLPRPANLDEMIHIAEHLSEGIDLVRVDLYSNGSRIWFGEMTLTPSGCIFRRWTRKALDELGGLY